jgi:hypothetical protein
MPIRPRAGRRRTRVTNCYVLLILHLSIILGNDQFDTQSLYFTIRLLWSSTCFEHYMLIIRRLNCIDAASGIATLKTSEWSKITSVWSAANVNTTPFSWCLRFKSDFLHKRLILELYDVVFPTALFIWRRILTWLWVMEGTWRGCKKWCRVWRSSHWISWKDSEKPRNRQVTCVTALGPASIRIQSRDY